MIQLWVLGWGRLHVDFLRTLRACMLYTQHESPAKPEHSVNNGLLPQLRFMWHNSLPPQEPSIPSPQHTLTFSNLESPAAEINTLEQQK